MQLVKTYGSAVAGALGRKVTDYLLLVKFRLTLVVVFSAVVAFLLASAHINYDLLFLLALGGFLITGSANALNQVIEKDYDRIMSRTANRPLPAGRMQLPEAILAAGIMGVSGITILSYFFSPLAGLLGAVSLISYSFIYTPLKRISPIAVFVGAFPGSLPLIIGWVCATGELGVGAVVLFLIQFLWQFPHFWSIAWVAHEDYTKAGFRLLPSAGGQDKMTAAQNIIYIAALIPVSLVPAFLGMTGWVSAVVVLAAGIGMMVPAVKLYLSCDKKDALKLMFASFIYLPVIFIALLIDKV